MTNHCSQILKLVVDQVDSAAAELDQAELSAEEHQLCNSLVLVQKNQITDDVLAVLDACIESADNDVRVWGMCGRVRAAAINRNVELVERMGLQAVQLGTSSKCYHATAWANRLLAVLRYGQARYPESLDFYKSALNQYSLAHDAAGVARITGNMGVVYQYLAEYGKALQHFREALEVHREMGNKGAEARVVGNMGNIYLNLADYPAALNQYQQALKLYARLRDKMGEATVTGNLGIVYSFLTDSSKALEYYLRAQDLHRSINDVLGQTRVESLIAGVYADQAKYTEAIEFCNNAIARAKEIGARDVVARAGTTAARSLAQLGRLEEADQILIEMDALAQEINSVGVTMSVKLARAEFNRIAGNSSRAIEGYVNSSILAKETGKRAEEAQCYKLLCELYEETQQWELAYKNNVMYHELRAQISGEEQQRRIAVMEAEKEYETERAASKREKDLLATILPSGTVERILAGEEVIADRYEGVAILFADIVGFTTTAATLSPDELIELLNSVFQNCDRIMKKHKCTRVKTIGDAYMAICGAPEVDELATFQMCKAAIELAKASTVALRIGVHYGPVVAGVIGTSRAAWDVWGDTVNVAARLESAGETGKVHVSENVIDNLKALEKLDAFAVEERGEVLLKGKGKLATYWIN